MAAPLPAPKEFDPLVEFYGKWNTRLAEDYLPIPGALVRKYECLRGHLIMSPAEGSASSYGESKFNHLMYDPVEEAGFLSYGQTNLLFTDDTWVVPDLTVLREPPKAEVWAPVSKALMPIEFVSPSSRRRDRMEKPGLYAGAGVPWYLCVEIDGRRDTVRAWLGRLEDGRYVEHAVARNGQRFKITEPFELDFDPAELLEP